MATKKRPTSGAPSGARARLIAEREARAAAERSKRRMIGALVAAVVLVLVIGIGVYGWWQSNKAPTAAAPTGAGSSVAASGAAGSAAPSGGAASVAPVAFAPVVIAADKGVRIGAADAPNVVSIYLDFHCSHCGEFEDQYGPTLRALNDSGRVTLDIWPLGFLSEGSKSASNAFACAAERDPRFARDLHDGFFANMPLKWSDDQILSLAKQIRPTLPDGFETCVTSKPHLDWVTNNFELARVGPAAKGTPTVYLNGQELALATLTPDTLVGMLK